MLQPPFRFGYIAFEDTAEPTSGYYSVAGSKGRRFDALSELPSDVIFWSNLKHNELYDNTSDLKGISTIRHDKYLVASPDDCLMEWGYNPKKMSADKVVVFVSRLFARIMTVAFNLIMESKPDRPVHQVFATRDLRNDIAPILPRAVYPKDEAAVVVKANYAYTDYTGTLLRGGRGMARVHVRRPRLIHALDMLMTPIPDGEMEFVSARDLSNPESVILTSTKPVLCEVSVSNIEANMASVLAFGNSMDAKKKVMRTWIAHPEALSMSAFSEITVKSIWRGEGYTNLYSSLPDPIIDFLTCKFAPTSWTAGIIAETIWKACCLRSTYRAKPGEAQADTSWRGLWLKSSDKIMTFVSAMEMYRKDWIVGSYGAGGLWLSCPPDQVEELVRSSAASGLIPRLESIPKTAGDAKWGGDTKSATMATLMLRRNLSMLLEIDKLMLLDQDQRAISFSHILKKTKEAS